jgi:Fe2+/Zn2+ uptake regulation proteins
MLCSDRERTQTPEAVRQLWCMAQCKETKEELMRLAGQRYSRQRELILNYLQSTKSHPSAEMVYNSLKKEHATLSLATVYRNLKLLAQDGTLICIPLPVERYDSDQSEHPHFWCKSCNQLMDMEEEDFRETMKQINRKSVHQIERCEILFTGICKNCQS